MYQFVGRPVIKSSSILLRSSQARRRSQPRRRPKREHRATCICGSLLELSEHKIIDLEYLVLWGCEDVGKRGKNKQCGPRRDVQPKQCERNWRLRRGWGAQACGGSGFEPLWVGFVSALDYGVVHIRVHCTGTSFFPIFYFNFPDLSSYFQHTSTAACR